MNLECPGLTPDQLNQNSLGVVPSRAYFLVKSSGDSSVLPRLEILDQLGTDTVSASWELQDSMMCVPLIQVSGVAVLEGRCRELLIFTGHPLPQSP